MKVWILQEQRLRENGIHSVSDYDGEYGLSFARAVGRYERGTVIFVYIFLLHRRV